MLVVAILGPNQLPEYAAKLGRFVRQARAIAEGAKGKLSQQMGPDFDDLDWHKYDPRHYDPRQYDPRQYDPRRIVREAMLDPDPGEHVSSAAASAARMPVRQDPDCGTPHDVDAT
jgi:sec-independent protein translocase protein TatB